MATTNWRSEVRLTADIGAAEQPAAEELSDERPFVIIVLSDFGGTTDSVAPDQGTPLHHRQLLDIHRDNFDAILARFNVRWEAMLGGLPGQPEAGMPAQFALRALEDFHPDRIVEQLMPLRSLIETRRRLESPSQFEAVAAEVMRWAQPTATDAPLRLLWHPQSYWSAFWTKATPAWDKQHRNPGPGIFGSCSRT